MNLIQMEWLTKSLKNLFKFNNISSHQANKIYKENYLCRIGSTSETVRDLEVYWNEHNNLNALKIMNDAHVFHW